MLLISLIISLFTLSFCQNLFEPKCSKELEKIVYAPDYDYKEYLVSISKELNGIASYYNTPQGQAYVKGIAIKYNIAVLLIDAMGNIEIIDPVEVEYVTSNNRDNIYSYHDARSVLNLGAYQNENIFAVYSFLSFNPDGVMLQITLAKPTVN